MEEIFDRCDENGNVIGTVSRVEAHHTGAWHKSVHIYLINNKNQILMQLRPSYKDIGPNKWDISVGGHVDTGEESIIAAARELREELGIVADTSELKYLFTYKETLTNKDYISNEFVSVYLIKKNVVEKDVKLQEEEVVCFKFIDLDEFYKKVGDGTYDFHKEEYKRVIQILKEKFKK